MTRKTRRTIFYVLVGLFFVIGAIVLLYADGWRWDFSTWRAEKVGAILVRSFPQGAQITLDGKPIANQSGILSQSTLISGLLPRTYNLALTEGGYLDWHENAGVLPSLVTEFKYAVLVPRAPASVSTDTVKNFFDASGELITQTEKNAIVWRGTTIGHGEIIGASTNLKTLIIKTGSGIYERYDFDAATTTNLSASLARGGARAANVTNVMVDPYDATAIVASGVRQIWIFDASATTTTLVESAPRGTTLGAAPVAASPSRLAWARVNAASSTSAVVTYDKFSKMIAVSSSTLPGKTQELKWITNSLLGILQDDGSLYTYDASGHIFQKLADDVKDFAAASDGTALAALENQSFEVFPFANAQTYHRFNLPNVADAKRIIWYKDANHLFVIYPDSVAFLDLDDLGLRNLLLVANGNDPLYSPQENVFYLINSAQKLEQFDFPS